MTSRRPARPARTRRWPGIAAAALAGITVLLVACTGDEPRAPSTDPEGAPSGGVVPPGSTPVLTAADLTPVPEPSTPEMGTPLPDDRVAEILDLWLEREPDPDALEASFTEIVEHRDVRFVAPLIELTWGTLLQVAPFSERHREVLEMLAGASHGRNWDRWVSWYGQTDLEPPPGFTTWKGRLFGRIDPRFADFLDDRHPADIRVELIAWGGVTVDGIFPLNDPPVVDGDSRDADYLDPDEPVLGLVVDGEARAYPLRIMDPHEVANDTLSGVPVTISYCTLCGTAIAYDGRGPDGTVYTFSTSGLLFQSNKLMYDRQTRTLWQQFTGRPVFGPLVEAAAGTSGPWLDAYPMVTTTWASWLEEHPDTTVLSIRTGVGAGYTLGFPYAQYYASENPAYPLSDFDLRLNAHDWVYGITLGGRAQAYDLRLLLEERVVNHEVGDAELVLVAEGDLIEVNTLDPAQTELVYDIGATVRAYQRPAGLTFSPGSEDGVVLDEDGGEWRVTEDALVAADGREAPRVFGRLSFWFAWFSFQPHTELLGGRER